VKKCDCVSPIRQSETYKLAVYLLAGLNQLRKPNFQKKLLKISIEIQPVSQKFVKPSPVYNKYWDDDYFSAGSPAGDSASL